MIDKIKLIIAESTSVLFVEAASIDNDTVLRTLGLDSLDAVEISMAIEDEFDIEFGDSEMDQAVKPGFTFRDLVRLVEGKVHNGTE